MNTYTISNSTDPKLSHIVESDSSVGLLMLASNDQAWNGEILAALCAALKQGGKKIATIEDEYYTRALASDQMYPSVDADVLAKIETEKPDVVCIGAIRDAARAQAALALAKTSLVIAVMHVPDAVGVSNRFEDHGIAPEKLSSHTIAIIERQSD